VAEAADLSVEFNWKQNTSATNNDPALSEFATETARGLGLKVAPSPLIMGGEDFALYQKRIPGVFWTIGIDSPQGAHQGGFIADMAQLSTAARLLAALAQRSLTRLSGG
jgi:metal-dependent amidase/aminoacylase/carboxypeptidase family protein